MAPALTEPVNHRQSKISSQTQASSPRPIISEINEQTQTTSNPHHRLAVQTNGGVTSPANSPVAKETNQLGENETINDTLSNIQNLMKHISIRL